MRKTRTTPRLALLRRYLRWRSRFYADAVCGSHPGLRTARYGLHAFMLLKPPQKGWLSAQDPDGGRQRFGRLLGELGPAEWNRAICKWRREHVIFSIGAALCLIVLGLLWLGDSCSLRAVFSLLFLAGCFGILALRAGYRRWQLHARRIGSLRDFLGNARNPPGKAKVR